MTSAAGSTGAAGASLTGLRVVEIGTSVAAPYGAQVLGDLGAEVIKVERHGTGDDARQWLPPEWEGRSVAFLSFNRNKKSVVLDYKTERGKRLLEELLASADVLIQNLRPGSLAKAGFTWERLRELNPRLIYCEMSGYGHTGPRAGQPAYDPMVQAYSGIVSITGDEDGDPARVPVSLLDMGTGMWSVIGIYEALRRRDATGRGSHVQPSLLQTALTWLTAPLMGVAAGGAAPKRLGSGYRATVPSGAFPTLDGHVFVQAGNNDTWHRLLEALDAQDLRDREGFGSNAERVRHRNTVNVALSQHTVKFTTAEVLERLGPTLVPHSAVHTVDQTLEDEQVRAIGQIVPLEHPGIPGFRVVNLPLTFDGGYPPHQGAPPELGADTRTVLASLGLAEREIDELFADGIAAGRGTAEAVQH